MPEPCGKCDVLIDQMKKALKCTECNAHFHVECTRSAADDRVSTRKSWKCDGCHMENSSNASSKTGVDGNAVLEAIAQFREESVAKWNESFGKLDAVQSELEKVRSDIGNLTSEVNQVKVETQQNSTDITQLKNENSTLNEKLLALTREVNDLQQHTRKNNLLITGVPFTRGECLYTILRSLAGLLNLKCYDSDISAVHRLPSNKEGGKRTPSIVVNFTSRAVKATWITARRRRKVLTASELQSGFPALAVYLNEHLTPQTRAVFNRARDLRKDGKLAFVWTADCRVLVKQSEKGPIIAVQSLDDLHRFSISDISPAK